MSPLHFRVCVRIVIMSLLHVLATSPCYISPSCEQHMILSLLHIPASCPLVCRYLKQRQQASLVHSSEHFNQFRKNSVVDDSADALLVSLLHEDDVFSGLT